MPVLRPAHFIDDVDALFCVGQWQAREFVSTLGFPVEKIFVTGNGVHHADFDPRPLAERVPAMRTLALLTDDKLWRAMSEAAIAKAQRSTYERLAQSWIAYFEDRLASAKGRLPYVDIDALGRFETASATDPEAKIVLEPAELAHLVKSAMTKFFGPG